MNDTAEQAHGLSAETWAESYMTIKSIKVSPAQSQTKASWQPYQVNWQPYQVNLTSSLNMPFERVVFKQDPRSVSEQVLRSLLLTSQRKLARKAKPVHQKRSLIALAAERVAQVYYPLAPFKACEGCEDRVVCETDERCLR